MLKVAFDDPSRVRLTLEDGSTREFVVTALAIDGHVKARRPPARAAFPPPETRETAAIKHIETIDGDDARLWLSGNRDADALTPETLGELLAVLGFMRRKAFKLDIATHSTNETNAIRKAINSGVKPSLLCRGILNASKDEFWQGRGDIRLQSLLSNLGRLTKPSASSADPRVILRGLIPRIREVDPIAANGIENEIGDATWEQAKAVVETWQGRLARAKR